MEKITKEERNKQVTRLHDDLLKYVDFYFDLWIREASNSRRTNLKHLNHWKLIKVNPLQEIHDGYLTFDIEVESKNGVHKRLVADWVEKYIKI